MSLLKCLGLVPYRRAADIGFIDRRSIAEGQSRGPESTQDFCTYRLFSEVPIFHRPILQLRGGR